MNENRKRESNTNQPKVTVEASAIEGIVSALGLELVTDGDSHQPSVPTPELHEVLETLAEIYEGVQAATENDRRGRSRKMVREYAGRGDLSSNEVGHLLRVLEAHDLVVQDGNRWRLAGEDNE